MSIITDGVEAITDGSEALEDIVEGTFYYIGMNHATKIELFPEYDFKIAKKQIRDQHRSKSGRLRLYKWADYNRIEFSLTWIQDADAVIINSWWDTNTELLFYVTSDSTTDVYSVMILNTDTPLSQYDAPYIDHRKGKMLLEGY